MSEDYVFSPTGKRETEGTTRKRIGGLEGSISSGKFIISWVVIVVVLGVVAVLGGRVLGITGHAYEPCKGAWGCVPLEFWISSLGAPIGVLAVAIDARRRGASGRKPWLRFGGLLLLSPAALLGSLVFLLATLPLAVVPEVVLSELSKSLIFVPVSGLVLWFGARTWVKSVGSRLLGLLAIWLATTLAISIPFASPSEGVLGTAAAGAGLSMMFVFVAARPIIAGSLRGVSSRLRYYVGSTLIIIGTLYLLVSLGGLLRWVIG